MFKTIYYYMFAVSGVTANPPNPGRNSWAGCGRWDKLESETSCVIAHHFKALLCLIQCFG